MLTKEKGFINHRRKFIGSPRWISWWVLLLCTVCFAIPLHASELHPLVITLVEARGDTYSEPLGGRIVIRNEPIHLYVRIRNTSEAAVSIRDRSDKAIYFELKEPTGVMFVVKMKKKADDDALGAIRVNLPAEAETITPIEITQDTWEGVPVLEAGKMRMFIVQVVYETAEGQHINSEPYTLIFNSAE